MVKKIGQTICSLSVINCSKSAAQKLSENFSPPRLTIYREQFTIKKMLHDFQLAGQKVRLWQRIGESYEHVLMKALGYAMFAREYPTLEIELKVGLRYKPDLIAVGANGDFDFWGECGQNSIRKTNWILKHTRTSKLVLFKIAVNSAQLIKQLRAEIPAKYRLNGKLVLINFVGDIKNLTAARQIEKVPEDWFTETEI